MDLQRLASTLLGKKRAETNNVMTDATTRTYIGTATSTSEDGSVYVELSEDVTLPDDDDGTHGLGVEMPTTVNVDEGDEVLVTVFGGGTMKAPVVTGNPGWGDRVQTQVNNAETLAQQANAVATATGQHFWHDSNGAHVTEVTQEGWSDSTSPNYHSGANVLLNAFGQLFRDGLNNLLALTTGSTTTETFWCTGQSSDYYVLAHEPMVVDSVTVDGVATDDYRWYNYDWGQNGGGGTLVLGYDAASGHYQDEIVVTYKTSPSMTIFNGLGNLVSNVMSYFTATEIGLGGDIYSDSHATSRNAAVRFFGATDGQGASLTSGTTRYSGEGSIDYGDSIGFGGRTTDADATISNGCVADYGVVAWSELYDDSESSDDYRTESAAALHAHSHGGDAYDGADATARLGVKTVTVGDDYARSYVTLGDGTGEDTEVPMEQAINAIPVPLYDNPDASASASATLSETAAGFSRLTIFFKDNDGNHASADVWNPDGKRVALAITWISGASTQEMYQRVRWVTISGTSISTYKGSGDAKYRTGQVKLGATASVTNADYISIVHVIGYR